jgi:RNA polymerase sigma-70 factor (ECF subfamily)
MRANRLPEPRVYTAEMTKTEQKTVRKAAAGDRVAFRELVLEHSHAMFRLAWRLTGDEASAEDIVQEAFIKAWRKIGDFRMQSSFRSWLHRITVNTAMDYLRRQAQRSKLETSEPEWERLSQASASPKHDVQIDVGRQTQAAMMNLSEIERAALMLRHFEGHSIGEIAQILELTPGACKQAVFRAVKKMRIELQPLVST